MRSEFRGSRPPVPAPTPALDLPALRRTLLEGTAELDVPLSAAQADALLAYLALLARWTQVYNLTAVRAPADMLRQHLLDSLAVVPAVKRHLRDRPPAPARLLDVGSGGGLPGIVLALLCPELSVTCVDTVGKKATFIRQAGAELRLPNLQAVHARVESLPSEPGYSLITARAFASLADLCRLTAGLLQPDGVWMAMKGQQPDEEMAALPATVEMFHVEPIRVPGLHAQRCLVWLRHAPAG